MRRFSPGTCSILIAALLCLSAAPAQRAPRPQSSADSLTSSDSLRQISEKLFFAGQYDSLVNFASGFVRRAESSGDSILLGRAINQRGRALMILGRPGAERDIDTAIRIAESIRDTTCLMPAVHFKGFAYWGAGRTDEAIKCFERRLSMAQRTRSPLDEAWARVSLGYSFHALGDQPRAQDEYERALALFHGNGARRLEIDPLIGLGRVASALGDGPGAIRWYRRALAASIETGDRMNEMWAANNLAVMETKQGDLSRSWEYLQHAIALARELNAPWGMVAPACNLAGALQSMGDFETAEEVLAEARTLCETRGAEDKLPQVDFYLAELRLGQGRYASAAAILRTLTGKLSSLESQHRDPVFMNLAQALAESDSLDAAIRLLSGYLNTPGRVFYGDQIPGEYLVLGHFYADAGDTRNAIRNVRRARELAIPAGQRRIMIASMFLESDCSRISGDRAGAAALFNAALDSLDVVRGGIGTPEWREIYGQRVARDVVDAGRVLLEYPDSEPTAMRERAFCDAIQRVKTRALIDRISRPRGVTAEAPIPMSNQVATLADVQSRLQPGEMVLDFYVGTQNSFLAAITADSLRIVELPGPASPLAERIQLLRTVVASTDPALRAQYDVRRLAEVQRALGREILGRVTDVVERSSRVFVCPDGYFAAVPFGLLITRDGGDVLMQERDIAEVPSISVLVMERTGGDEAMDDDRRVITISASGRDLSGAREEVQELAQRYRHVEHFVDLRDLDAFAQAARRCDALHIASHALVVDRAPWWSGIQLRSPPASESISPGDSPSPTGTRSSFLSVADSMSIERAFPSDPYLRAWQIARLHLPSKLAVLSACETAGGRMTTGEGTLGLTAAFLSAGVPVVVSSLWPVDDRATAAIMRTFYRHLSAGETVATALRLAQLDARRSPKYSHPFYWSGFTVVGDGSLRIPIERRLWPWHPMLLGVVGAALCAVVGVLLLRRRAHAFVR